MNEYTLNELKGIARNQKIPFNSSITKRELYNKIQNWCTSGYHTDIARQTTENTKLKKELFRDGDSLQLAVMSLKPLQEIGLEAHPETTQFIRIEKGRGTAIIGCQEFTLKSGSAFIIPRGVPHTVINTSRLKDLKMYTIYSNDKH